ncbi:MAG TPA: hypothetical protein VMH39_08820 [Gemmatimonadaceae bacterium]|nr:hypothetical protein [Gemmatimonadaceae bacterium]
MSKLLAFLGATVGSSLGWAFAGVIGFGLMGEFMLSIVGTAAGVYVGRRLANHYDL